MSYRAIPLAIAFVVGSTAAAVAQAPPADESMMDFEGAALQFEPIQPPGFDAGMKIAAIHGDPSVPDEPYVIRLSFEDGYRFPPHYHPRTENLTVLEGTFLLAMGRRADESQLKSYAPGDFLYIPAEHPHYGGAEGATVIQLHGVGPFDILLVED